MDVFHIVFKISNVFIDGIGLLARKSSLCVLVNVFGQADPAPTVDGLIDHLNFDTPECIEQPGDIYCFNPKSLNVLGAGTLGNGLRSFSSCIMTSMALFSCWSSPICSFIGSLSIRISGSTPWFFHNPLTGLGIEVGKEGNAYVRIVHIRQRTTDSDNAAPKSGYRLLYRFCLL